MNDTPAGGLHWVDGTIIVVYLVLLSWIGYHFSRKQHSLEEFIRGSGKYGWLTLGLSLMAALNSGLDYVQTPALVFATGLVCVTSVLSWIPLYPWISRVTLPFYQRLDTYSTYEYLEMRFGVGVRLLGAGIAILWRMGWMGTAIYAPCLAVSAATGGELDIRLMVLVLGVIVTVYTMLGGMKAVVWTDVVQCCVMLGGLIVTFYAVIQHVPGGVGELFRQASDAGRLSIVAPAPAVGGGFWAQVKVFFTTEVTATGYIVAVLLSRATAFTSDQIAIQRFQSSASLSNSRRSYIVNAVADAIWILVLGFVGLALFAYYRHFPLPDGMQNDRVLPHFMLQHFPIGVIGLVIAAIFAASLSSVDSALNACASIIVVDFYNRLWLGRVRPLKQIPADEERRQLRVSRLATLGLGVVMILIGINVDRMGEIYQAANKLIGAFFGPLFGIFVLGMFSRGAHSAGVLCGAAVGLASSCFASFFSAATWLQFVCGVLFGPGFVDFFQHLSWLWPAPIGITVTLATGLVASRLLPAPVRVDPPLTFAEVMKLPARPH